MAKKKSKRYTALAAAKKGAGIWFHNEGRCLAAGWRGFDNVPDMQECGQGPIDGRLEYCHIRRRKHKIVIVSCHNGVLCCQRHHNFLDENSIRMDEFVNDMFPGRTEMLDALILEHYLDGSPSGPRLLENYQFWAAWYKSRPEGESYLDFFRSRAEV